ncbi:putative P-loop containing nucleoside triphosphate hydrolase [Helianthus annuus]|nr:putative P-loop containing nucleoside triphosphate hydrolase [Helianthus annuus]
MGHVSQTYDKHGVLIQILESIHAQLDLEKTNDSQLRELVHRHLFGKRYLIVIDDIWHIQTWDKLKVFFPHDNSGSRILLTRFLAKEEWSEEFWKEIADKTGSYIAGDQNGCMETLALSYNHLPLHLRECFLYLGGFLEDYEIKVRKLIRLWMAEGFIHQARDRSLEDIAESYLMDLIDRSLVTVEERKKLNGAAKTCKLHDLVRELCLKKAKEEQFIL